LKTLVVAPGISQVNYEIRGEADLFFELKEHLGKALSAFARRSGSTTYANVLFEYMERDLGGREELKAVFKSYVAGRRGPHESDDKELLDQMGLFLAGDETLKRFEAAKIVAKSLSSSSRHGRIKNQSIEHTARRLDGNLKNLKTITGGWG
jgi:hypothetical protein